MPGSPSRYFEMPLLELEAAGLQGILGLPQASSRRPVGVTAQFLEDADKYHALYTAHGYFRNLIQSAVSRAGIGKVEAVLDLGSGSGNSVVPALELFPAAEIVAVDISPQLLAILKKYVARDPANDRRLFAVCMDASTDPYVPDRFDLCIGAAILHHMLDPEAVIRAAMKALKPGGHAIFFEPFEGGNAMLRLAYARILDSPRARLLRRPVRNLLRGMVRDYSVRMDTSPGDPVFATLDDKWMFTRGYFQKIAERVGARVAIEPLHELKGMLENQTRSNLRLGAGLGPEALPGWVWSIVREMDELLPLRVKEDLLIEGCVTFTK
jgi:SAM-dependent methyltransferase